jgi:hypothetical protein
MTHMLLLICCVVSPCGQRWQETSCRTPESQADRDVQALVMLNDFAQTCDPSAMQADEGFKVFMEEGAELLTLKMKGMKDYYLKNVSSKVFRTSVWCCNTSVQGPVLSHIAMTTRAAC